MNNKLSLETSFIHILYGLSPNFVVRHKSYTYIAYITRFQISYILSQQTYVKRKKKSFPDSKGMFHHANGNSSLLYHNGSPRFLLMYGCERALYTHLSVYELEQELKKICISKVSLNRKCFSFFNYITYQNRVKNKFWLSQTLRNGMKWNERHC